MSNHLDIASRGSKSHLSLNGGEVYNEWERFLTNDDASSTSGSTSSSTLQHMGVVDYQ